MRNNTDLAFPIRGIAANPKTIAPGAIAPNGTLNGIPVRSDPSIPENEIHIISNGKRLVIKYPAPTTSGE